MSKKYKPSMVEMLFYHKKKTLSLCLYLLNASAELVYAWESYI